MSSAFIGASFKVEWCGGFSPFRPTGGGDGDDLGALDAVPEASRERQLIGDQQALADDPVHHLGEEAVERLGKGDDPVGSGCGLLSHRCS
jgi:hypothetical protein